MESSHLNGLPLAKCSHYSLQAAAQNHKAPVCRTTENTPDTICALFWCFVMQMVLGPPGGTMKGVAQAAELICRCSLTFKGGGIWSVKFAVRVV